MPDAPHKTHEVAHPVLDVIRRRWSPAIYSPQPVEPEKLLSILEAARWAPSSYNAQPWSFLVARKEEPEEFDRMLSCIVPGNVAWAQHVPVLMISVAKLDFDHGKVNRHAFHDTGIATGFLMLEAASLGILAHGMAGFDQPRRASCTAFRRRTKLSRPSAWVMRAMRRARRKSCANGTRQGLAGRSTNLCSKAAGDNR